MINEQTINNIDANLRLAVKNLLRKVSSRNFEPGLNFLFGSFIHLVRVLMRAANAASSIAPSIPYTYTSQCQAFAIASLVNATYNAATSASRRSYSSRRRGNSGVNGAVSYRYHNRFVDTHRSHPVIFPSFGRERNSS